MTTHQVIDKIFKDPAVKFDLSEFEALKKHNFTRLMRQGKPVYAVKEYSYEEVDAKNKEVEQ